ncbi:MAG: hypothetical protein A3I61_06915 [Acidobacteria bacterium RIFCSPLOWO2_02_FULL_68_18]|nr:MAG: hypothetical protein A3I61_06915 [Acidobacteria bacterium RIFCSPLOWO2_02_FULL_68_18]OFW48323.1 MAG: hypothetical protein A3G77_03505 [Acidobacteria bacterium RIFCSPLOWO2_12_FULL_68_19]
MSAGAEIDDSREDVGRSTGGAGRSGKILAHETANEFGHGNALGSRPLLQRLELLAFEIDHRS